MLMDLAWGLIHRLLTPLCTTALFSRTRTKNDASALLEKAEKLFAERCYRDSLDAWSSYLELRPHDIDALNNMGVALANLGRSAEAAQYFDKAYSLDDSHLPSIVNYATSLVGRQQAAQAMELLRKARIQSPLLDGVRAGYSSILFAGGQSEHAIEHAMHAWLARFDISRSMDQYLWTTTYLEEDEARLAAEHRFWAGTLPSRSHDVGPPKPESRRVPFGPQGRRLRIGYWSPDLREHSVRYFFRPLLEGHDRSQVEIFVYHDHHVEDTQTALMRPHADHFHSVAELNDEQLAELLHSHQLDVLVELAGHTSANRMDMLRYRFASLQVSGLGYPPTTGLTSIDAKFLDVHLLDADMSALYSETPAILPQSFWCFDPKMDLPPPPPLPPVLACGRITFGCFGNIGKITSSVMYCWGRILARVPRSRLLLRAANFADLRNKHAFEQVLANAGVPLSQVELLAPVSPRDLFKSYGEDIDIVLDTFPFNGGTTTCYATYAGVPVVTRKGRALASRMGESVMTNLGMADWVTDSADAYVERAVRAAQDVEALERFRREVRGRFQACALGNGALFARDVEAFYREWLQNPPAPVPTSSAHVLPADELVRRALITLRYGQFDVARRIVNYCLMHYPRCGAAHVLWTERLTSLGRFAEAARYLREQRPHFDSPADHAKALVNEVRFLLVAGELPEADKALAALRVCQTLDAGQRNQFHLLECARAVQQTGSMASAMDGVSGAVDTDRLQRMAVCVVTDDAAAYEAIAMQLQALPLPAGLHVHTRQCPTHAKSAIYQQIADEGTEDVLVCLHANVSICRRDFWWQLAQALLQCDLVGSHGARRWDRLEWRTHSREAKAGAHLLPSGEKEGFWEIYAFSRDPHGLATGLEVVDGSFLAINLHALRATKGLAFEEELDEAGALLEEYFCLRAARQGLCVGACANLGIALDWRVPFNDRYLGQGRLFVAEQLQFDPWFFPDDEQAPWSVSLPSAELAMAALNAFNAEENWTTSSIAE